MCINVCESCNHYCYHPQGDFDGHDCFGGYNAFVEKYQDIYKKTGWAVDKQLSFINNLIYLYH